MGIVSGIEKRGKLAVIYVDGRRLASVPPRLFKARPLVQGQEIDETEYLAWLSGAEYPSAHEYALVYLGPRARSEREMHTALAKRGYQEDTICEVIRRLRGVHLLNDEAFATSWVQQRSPRGKGKRALGQELRMKGIDDEQIEGAISGISGEDELATALRLAQKLAPRYRIEEAEDRRARYAAVQKLSQALARRGYDWDTIATVLERLAPDEPND